MKIKFEDQSYIEFRPSTSPGKIFIIIQAKDQENPLKKITNSVEISMEQFKKLVASIPAA